MIYLDEHPERLDLERAMAEISAQRREQALRIKHEQGRRLCVAAYRLLQQGLRQEYGIEEPPVFSYQPHGKPELANYPQIHFNMSHCRVAALCALSDRPIGTDIESIRKYNQRLVDYTMNEREAELIRQAERPDVAFVRLWTMKEARQKLTGSGIGTDMRHVLTGNETFETVENLERGYIYTVCTAI